MINDVQRILCVLPGLPETKTGGGLLLHEVLAHLATRGHVEVVVPVPNHLRPLFEEAIADPRLEGVTWHPLEERRTPGLRGMLGRALSAAPADMAKFAVPENRAVLDTARRNLAPTAELVISTGALSAYPGFRMPAHGRLYMVNVDPDIIRHYGPSLKRKLACEIDRPKVSRLCRHALHAAARVGSISPHDVPALERLGRRADVGYVPPLMRPRPLDRSQVEPDTVLITTNFTYTPNVISLEWFLNHVWPRVNARARLTVTGKDEGDALAAVCRRHDRVTYAGCLDQASLDQAFARTAVAVNPTRSGSGFQIKLLDAIARGVPIVSTAFSNRIGPEIAASDDPARLAALIDERLTPGSIPPFDYAAFHARAIAAWDEFLFGEDRPRPKRTEPA